MKETYIAPEVTVIELEAESIIADSEGINGLQTVEDTIRDDNKDDYPQY